jgi:p24 family protein beta-1
MYKQIKQSTGTASITAVKDGRHEYCFSNAMSTVVDKLVRCAHTFQMTRAVNLPLNSFNVHGVIYVDYDGAYISDIDMSIPRLIVLRYRRAN